MTWKRRLTESAKSRGIYDGVKGRTEVLNKERSSDSLLTLSLQQQHRFDSR